MKIFTMIAAMLLLTFISNAQILATTSAGKKVILNNDFTWKYAGQGQDEQGCVKSHYGTAVIHNNTNQDIYFYYALDNEYARPEYLQVKAHNTRTIEGLYMGSYNVGNQMTGLYDYPWRAVYEVQDVSTLAYLQGAFEKNHFKITECQTTDVQVGN